MKNQHAAIVPGLADYVAEFTSDAAWGGEFGYLTDRGLIPLGDEDREAIASQAQSLEAMTQAPD